MSMLIHICSLNYELIFGIWGNLKFETKKNREYKKDDDQTCFGHGFWSCFGPDD